MDDCEDVSGRTVAMQVLMGLREPSRPKFEGAIPPGVTVCSDRCYGNEITSAEMEEAIIKGFILPTKSIFHRDIGTLTRGETWTIDLERYKVRLITYLNNRGQYVMMTSERR